MIHRLWRTLPQGFRRALFDRAVRVPTFWRPLRPGEFDPTMPFYVVGPLRSSTGLGEAARLAVLALREAALDVTAVDFGPDLRQPSRVTFDCVNALPEGAGILLVFANPPNSSYLIGMMSRAALANKMRIGCWVWEYDRIPPRWVQHATAFHEIVAPSDYCARAFARVLGRRVKVLPHPVAVAPPGTAPKESAVGSSFTVGFVGDLIAAAGRKYPAAVVEAVAMAFPGDPTVRLKLILPGSDPSHPVRKAVAELARVRHVELEIDARELDHEQHRSRLAKFDCYMSLHRAEGFGLTIAEAMAMGLPTIATATPAVAEYLDDETGYPVRFETEPAPGFVDLPDPGGWAAPDIAEAAAFLQQVRSNPDEGRRRGRAAATRIVSRFGGGSFRASLFSLIEK